MCDCEISNETNVRGHATFGRGFPLLKSKKYKIKIAFANENEWLNNWQNRYKARTRGKSDEFPFLRETIEGILLSGKHRN